MADLTLDVRKSNLIGPDGVHAIDLGAVARIKRIDMFSPEQSVAVNVGKKTMIRGLEAGDYEVQVYLPSGTVISKQIVVKAGRAKPVAFDATGAPESFLSWQHLSGAVPSGDALRAITMKAIGPAPTADLHPPVVDLEQETSYRAARAETKGKPSVLAIRSPATRHEATVDPAKVKAVWTALADGVVGKTKPVSMVSGFFQYRVPVSNEAPGLESWEFGLLAGDFDSNRPPRAYVLVEPDGSFEFGCLPLPWHVDLHDQKWRSTEFVDVLVDKTVTPKSVRTTVMVRDQKYAGLIAFMNNGAFHLANELLRADGVVVQDALELLGHKSRNPLGACAAAYVLLSTSSFADAEQQSWFPWIEKLGTDPLYGWIPDAAIIYARVKLLSATTATEARAAIPYLYQALRGGLPFYSLGLTWLVETLTHFKDKDPLIKSVFKKVDRVARHMDANQTFLVLKLGGKK